MKNITKQIIAIGAVSLVAFRALFTEEPQDRQERIRAKLITIAIAMIALVTVTGCTENTRAKSLGGTATVKLPAG